VRALVTGGAGFIGSHLTDALLAAGDEVTVVDHLSVAKPNLDDARSRGVQVVCADVADTEAMRGHLRGLRPEAVYHLAAQIDVRKSVEDPSIDAHVNIGGTAAVLTAARDAGVRRVVLASTAGVYGDPQIVPTPERAPIAPLSPYGASKAAAESYLAMWGRLHGLSTVSLRMSNVYGPRQNPHGEAGVIAIFCGAAIQQRAVTIYGDGGQTRDFIYVGDVVDAFVRAGRSDVSGALNVCTGRETSLAGLVATLGLSSQEGPGRLGEIRRSCLDPRAAATQLDWWARTPLADGLERTLAWLRQ
jgi:UDP-glucose 4-epimerase